MGAQIRQSNVNWTLDQNSFDRIAKIIAKDAGIELQSHKLTLVQSRMTRRLKVTGCEDFSAYCDLVESEDGTSERLEMTSALTTNVTGFFREQHHFDYLRQQVIPGLLNRLKGGERIRVWSAGCSTGEEPYSLALTFLDAAPDVTKYDFKILATDIDPMVLETALRGVYGADDMNSVPEHLKYPFFEQSNSNLSQFSISKQARALVVFRRLNLVEKWPFSKPFDLILCRNVVIYFGDATKSDIWKRMSQSLTPNGLLMTGHSERLSGPAGTEFNLVATTTYQLSKPKRLSEGLAT